MLIIKILFIKNSDCSGFARRSWFFYFRPLVVVILTFFEHNVARYHVRPGGKPEGSKSITPCHLSSGDGKKSRMESRYGTEDELKLDKAEQPYYNGRRHPRRGCSAEGARFLRKE